MEEKVDVVEKIKQIRKKSEKKTKDYTEISYDNFIKNKIYLTKYKLPELKTALKNHNLKISGKKDILIERLESYFNNTKRVLQIQSAFRGWLVRIYIKLKGPAFKNVAICLNDTDFITLEPLTEIKKEYIYSYIDDKKHIYGFDITSLIHIIKSNKKLQNPYNREKISQKMIDEIKRVYRITFMLFPLFKNNNQPFIQNQTYNRTNPVNRQGGMNRNQYMNVLENERIHNLTTEMTTNQNRLAEIRTKSINERINLLFVEIDSLGNYTQSSWFNNLDIRSYIRLYRILYEIWNYRGNLSRDLRNQICPNQSPFDGIFPRIVYHEDLTLEQIRIGCLIVFENMIYLGTNEENRRLGAFHALSGLTIVSQGARQAMPWLYESVAI
jgi:hypothetical protein